MNTVIATKQGKVQGKLAEDFQGGKYYSFQGIPYAKPPIGVLRFRAPQHPDTWNGIRDCTKEASECLAPDFWDAKKIAGSEDCLYLNVYTPQLPDGGRKLKPVMFWIHGGGFTAGSSKTDNYGPDYLISEDIVLVTTNYRLGVLGLLSLEDPSLGVPGNNAFKDMIMGLKWVQQNIHNFNGDPNNVTIFGESAGGAAVHLLVLSPMAKGLFNKAIIQSGSALNPWPKGTRCAKELASIMEFKSNDEKEILDMLKNVPAKSILEAQMKTYDGLEANMVRTHGYVIEKPSDEPAFLTEDPLDILRNGKQNKVPIMTGYTNKEGMLTEFVMKTSKGDENYVPSITDFETKIPHRFNIPKGSELSKKIAGMMKQFYFDGKDYTPDMLDGFYDLESDRYFVRGIQMGIKHHIKSAPEIPIYFYNFTVDTWMNALKKLGNIKHPGASHFDEIGYLFKTAYLPTPTPGSVEDLTLRRMIRLWSNFARTANPNPITPDTLIDVAWKPVTPDRLYFLGIGESLSQGTDPEKKRMRFWDEISSMVPAAKDM